MLFYNRYFIFLRVTNQGKLRMSGTSKKKYMNPVSSISFHPSYGSNNELLFLLLSQFNAILILQLLSLEWKTDAIAKSIHFQ